MYDRGEKGEIRVISEHVPEIIRHNPPPQTNAETKRFSPPAYGGGREHNTTLFAHSRQPAAAARPAGRFLWKTAQRSGFVSRLFQIQLMPEDTPRDKVESNALSQSEDLGEINCGA